MKIKCIGGNLDGEWVELDRKYRIGDNIRFPQPVKFELQELKEVLVDITAPEPMKYDTYVVGYISGLHPDGSAKTIYYCHPVSWHTWEALEHQFNK